MGDGFQFIDIILFALIAAFLVLRLRGVLGRRDGFKGRPRDPFAPPAGGQADNENVVALPDRGNPDAVGDAAETEPTDPIEAGLARLRRSDPGFDIEEFLVGARTAFEMIISAFAAGDTEALKPLLSRDVFANFAEEIAKREESGETLETVVTAIRISDIVEARVDGRTARLTVKFVSDQTNLTRDHEGRLIEGDPEATTEVSDFWTFERALKSRDPNWTLVATGTLD
ncbi:Tim44/TimA family putative adaptor protein [Shumkonia mesophila]|uniref:Tim44/TimA family putative adaptor protein n=1 Tax=Shumkonia mesophila TaxID=2838854 RepID=UPI002934F137|nr:Tim44/TimA family putative adaptor protein [Shumkonia mesophila]